MKSGKVVMTLNPEPIPLLWLAERELTGIHLLPC
jgi:hypothetical protein